jgi:catechol 2,3-dioxygenase-like lactoylglutathione lyase family enzyme
MTRLVQLRPFLEVTDVDETIAFYTDVLGFTVTDSIAAEGHRLWANLLKDDVRLMVNRMHTHDEDDDDDHGHDHPHEPALTGSLYFNVDDVDKLAIDLGGKVPLEYGPTTQPHGMREIAIVDPNGYFLVFGTPSQGGVPGVGGSSE